MSVLQVTKKYAIDLLNCMFFSNEVSWDGVDQFNALSILNPNDELDYKETRGCLLVSKNKNYALRLVITVNNRNGVSSVCYRVSNLTKKILLSDPQKEVFPLNVIKIDFSISDLNMGCEDLMAQSFSDNTVSGHEISQDKLLSFTKFLLDASPVVLEESWDPKNGAIFSDLINSDLSDVPNYNSDHYVPIYGVSAPKDLD